MAITEFQRQLCRVIAKSRIERGESYVAGGVALNTLLGASRTSADIDLFHDTEEALAHTWDADRELLQEAGYQLTIVRERPSFVEAMARKSGDSVILQWVRDSAFRFFPLVEHPEFGFVLHPFDLATNKVLALVGRLEVRDWVDVISCHDRLQPLGYLVWAACAKDPGFGPGAILAEAARGNRHSQADLLGLSFGGEPPSAAALSLQFRQMLTEAERIVDSLPAEEVGKCVLDRNGELFKGPAKTLPHAISDGALLFHAGSIRGAYPTLLKPHPI